MKQLFIDARVQEDPFYQVATPPGMVLRFTGADQPGKMVAIPVTGEQPPLQKFKPRETNSGARPSAYSKSLTD